MKTIAILIGVATGLTCGLCGFPVYTAPVACLLSMGVVAGASAAYRHIRR